MPARLRSVLRRRRVGAVVPLLALGLVLAGATPARAAEADDYEKALATAAKLEASLVKAVERVRPSSVSVLQRRLVKRRGETEPELVVAGCGSGVIVETRGGKQWVLTNFHVIEGADALSVITHDGVEHAVVEHDSIAQYDISLLKFEGKPRPRLKGTSVEGRVSSRKIKEGTWVIATGNPFFLAIDGRSVTTLGVISGLDRFLGGKFQYVGAIQHDAEVNPGNSGGPLWNLKGELVGLNGKIAGAQRFPGANPSNSGASFSLAVEQIDAFIKRLTQKHDAKAAYFGVETETHQDDKGEAAGARVVKVDPRSPAASGRGRLQPGDVIQWLWIGGRRREIATASDWREELATLGAGSSLKLKYKRGKRSYTWTGVLDARR